MAVIAKLRYLRIAPRKVRLVADLVRGKLVEDAQTILNFTVKKASQPLLKLLKSAVSNAENNFKLDAKNLFISKITVDEGPKYKRWMPRARGQAYEIQKKTSHVTIVLEEIKKSKKEKKEIKSNEKEEIMAKKEENLREESFKKERPKFKSKLEMEKPKVDKGIRKIFRRKAVG